MCLTSVSIVLEPGNIRERKFRKFCLFVIKEQIKDLFLYQHLVFGSHYNRLSANVFPKRFARSARLFSPFFDSLVFGCGVVGLSKPFARAIYIAALASLS